MDTLGLILFNRRDWYQEIGENILAFDIGTGVERPITNENLLYAKSWSPDGTHILVLEGNDNPFKALTMFIIDADGRNRQQLTDPDKLNPSTGGIWSPDGSRIFFWAHNMKSEVGQPRWAMYTVSANGGSVRRLIEPTLSVGGLALSPDGTQIIYTQDFKLYSMTSEGENIQVTDIPLHRSPTMAWSPDGSQLAATTSGRDNKFGIYVFEPDGSNMRFLVTDMGDIHSIKWSPDGSELLFMAHARGSLALTLGIVNVKTSAVDTYEVGEGVLESLSAITHAVWSPDGLQIAFSGVPREDNPYNMFKNLYLVDRNLTQIQQLTDIEASDDVVDWRP